MAELSVLRIFSGARTLCTDIEEAIGLVCAITKLCEDEVLDILSTAGVLVVPGSEAEREIRNFIIENAEIKTTDQLKREVGFRFCICDDEAERLVEKWFDFPYGIKEV